jgi:hypothetical protein
MTFHWTVAVKLAKSAEDVTFEEWCALYVDHKNPTAEQIRTACEAAHPILVRNGAIESSVVIDQSPR